MHDDRTTTTRGSYFLTLRLVPDENLLITSTTYLQSALQLLRDRVEVRCATLRAGTDYSGTGPSVRSSLGRPEWNSAG